MDLSFRSAAKTSIVSGQTITPGAQLVSFLTRDQAGELHRYDLLKGEEEAWSAPETVLARWQRTVPDEGESAADARARMLRDTEGLFRALAGGEMLLLNEAEADEENTELNAETEIPEETSTENIAGENPEEPAETVEEDTASAHQPDALAEEDRAALLYLLGLQLERKRWLRAMPGEGRHFGQPKTKEVFHIPAVELTPPQLLRLEGFLGALVG